MKKLFILFSLVLFLGCGSSANYLYLEANRESNQGRPVSFFFRYMTEDEFLKITYQDAIALQNQKDAKVNLQWILPGEEKEVEIPLPESNIHGLGIFFFFQNPEDPWKIYVPPPVPEELTLKIGRNRIEYVQW